MVKNFRYEEEGAVALSGVPETPEAVDWLYEQGIRTVISLHPVPPEVEARMRERGIEWHPFLISDFSRDVPPGLSEVLEFTRARAGTEPAALIH
jgi:hypothetical protein